MKKITDKDIIIDGVDISKCRFYKEGLCCLSYAFVENGYDCVECCECNDCDYKQLQHKEQECKELIVQRDTFIKLTNVYKDLSKGRKDTKIVIDYINNLKEL